MKIFFFIGKGGVGKSTLSSLTALYLAKQNYKVLLTSLDPAHNLTDIFEKNFSDKPLTIIKNLEVLEIEHDRWIKAFLKQSTNQLKTSYSYLTTFSMDKHFSVMQHAPALEEYALHQAFINIIEKNKQKDYLIFDMPPTALALKFFALPQLSLLWLENLLDLRNEIKKKQEIISKLSLGSKTFERDRVMQNIDNQKKHWQNVDKMLKNKYLSYPVVVENPDQLSVAESKRIIEKMASLEMAPVIKALNNAVDNVKEYNLVVKQKKHVTGLKNLQEMVDNIDFSNLF